MINVRSNLGMNWLAGRVLRSTSAYLLQSYARNAMYENWSSRIRTRIFKETHEEYGGAKNWLNAPPEKSRRAWHTRRREVKRTVFGDDGYRGGV